MNKLEFIKTVAELAVKCPSSFYNSVTIAQACLESDWGRSELAVRAKNIFGIKASYPWTGRTYNKKTKEESPGGEQYAVFDNFRVYDSWAESVKDHAGFMESTEGRKEIYKKAINAKTPEDQARALAKTYASDSKYGQKLIKLINEYDLKKYDKERDSVVNPDRTRPFEQDITTVNMGGSLPAENVKYLVFHFVGAAGQARNNGQYFRNVFRSASAHLFIDPNVTVQVVPFNRVGWHIGDGHGKFGMTNQNAVGVELCQDTSTGDNVWKWDFNADTRKEAILVFDYLMNRFNVPIERVVRHYDCSRKSCPGNWMSNNWSKWWLWKEDLNLYHTTGKLVDSQRGITYSEGNGKAAHKATGKVTHTTPKLTNREVAKQVVRGDWGNGEERKRRLAAAGYDYNSVQIEVGKYKEELKMGVKKPVEIPKSVGIYKFKTNVWVRSEPHSGKDTITKEGYMYTKDDTVSIEKVIERDGIVWGQYTAYSGATRYVKLGVVDGPEFAQKL